MQAIYNKLKKLCIDLKVTVFDTIEVLRFLDHHNNIVYNARYCAQQQTIIIDKRETLENKVYSLAHELGHHLINHKKIYKYDRIKEETIAWNVAKILLNKITNNNEEIKLKCMLEKNKALISYKTENNYIPKDSEVNVLKNKLADKIGINAYYLTDKASIMRLLLSY